MKTLSTKKRCKTCKFWDFKVETDKAWGMCMNKKVHESTYISVQIPDDIESTDEMHRFMEWVHKYTIIYFEENSFGCIYHESRNN